MKDQGANCGCYVQAGVEWPCATHAHDLPVHRAPLARLAAVVADVPPAATYHEVTNWGGDYAQELAVMRRTIDALLAVVGAADEVRQHEVVHQGFHTPELQQLCQRCMRLDAFDRARAALDAAIGEG